MIKKFAILSSLSLLALLVIIAGVGVTLLNTKQEASAAQAKDFNPGRIIDDFVFYNSNSMNASQIQSFLNSKVPTCDTNGTGRATDWGRPDITRATLASYIRNGTNGYNKNAAFHAPPYTCLRDYKKNTPQMEAASGLCAGISAKTNQTSAQMIMSVATACGINPQVLVVLLEKEQSLVTDVWPLQRQFNSATGFDCPDTAPCDPAYAGLFYQIYYAARQFKVYQKYPNNYNYVAGRTNRIYWHPDLSRCGSSQVLIENQATAALYIYTPYRPNQAALNNLYGTGDSCSSYGNRNFWRIFTDWFGSTKDDSIKLTRSLFFSPSHANPIVGEATAASFIIRNTSKSSLTVQSARVAAKSVENDTVVYYPATGSITIPAGQSYEYYKSTSFDVAGKYQLQVQAITPSGDWSEFWPYNESLSVVRERFIDVRTAPTALSVSRSLFYSPASQDNFATTKDLSSTSFVLKNNSNSSVRLDGLRVSARHISSGTQITFPEKKGITIGAGEEYTYHEQTRLNLPGEYRLEIQAQTAYGSWVSHWPAADSSNVVLTRNVTVNEPKNVKIVRDLWVSPVIAGQSIGASFIIKNNESEIVSFRELAVRATSPNGETIDFPSINEVSLDPGEEYTYYQFQTFQEMGDYKFKVISKIKTSGWVDDWPEAANNVKASASVRSRLANITLERNLWRSPVNVKVGQNKSVSFVIKNNESRNIKIDSIAVGARYQDGSVVDFPHIRDLVLTPGQSYEYYQSRTLDRAGAYRIFIVSLLPSQSWSYDWPVSSTTRIVRSDSFSVGR